MLLLQLNEATAAQRRIPFYAVDVIDGFTPETGLSSFAVDVSENGGARASGGGSDPTEVDSTNMPGYYYYEATAAEVSTLGFLAISIKHANMRDFFAIAQVVAFDPYDAAGLGLTNLDTTISSRSSHSAADVWTTGSRELSTPNNYKATGFSTHNAADVWTAGSRALSTPSDYMADLSTIEGKLPTNYIMGSSDQADNNVKIDSIFTRLPTNSIMGSSDGTDKDDEIDAIYNKLPTGNMVDTTDVYDQLNILLQVYSLNEFIIIEERVNGGTPTTIEFLTDLIEATPDHYNGMLLTFISGALTGQGRFITDYDGAGLITVSPALTEPPSDSGTDYFIITHNRVPPASGAADWTSGEKENMRSALGIDGAKTGASGGQLQTITGKLPTNNIMGSSIKGDKDGVIDGIDSKTTNLPGDPASETNINANETKIDTMQGNITNILGDTDTMEADLKTYLDAIETNLDGDIVAVKTDTGNIDTKTTNLPGDPASETNVNANETKIDAVKSDTAAILLDTDTMEADLTTEINANETKIDAAITDIGNLNNLSSSDVQTVLETNDLDHLLKVAHPSGDPVQNTIMDLIMNKDGSQNFARANDSLEAIRDRGDAEWITGGAGAGATIQVIPSIPKNIDLAATKTVRIALYLIDQNDDLPTTGEITVGTIKIERSADGGTSWSTIRDDVACSKHAGGIYYDEVFSSGNGYASADMIKITFKSQKVTISANDHEITDGSDGMVFITRIDSGLSGGGPSAGDIADAVWNEPIADHTSSSQFGGKNQKVVPSETLADYKATGFATSGALATHDGKLDTVDNYADTMEADLKTYLDAIEANLEGDIEDNDTLIDTVITNIAALQTDLDNPNQYKASGFSVPNEYDGVIATIQTDLDNPGQFKADVSGLTTESNATTNKTSIITEIDANETKIDAVKTDTGNIDTKTINLPGDPASETNVNANETKIDTLQSDLTTVKGKTDNLPADTEAEITILKGLGKLNIVLEWSHDGSGDNNGGKIFLYDTKTHTLDHVKGSGLQSGGLLEGTITTSFTNNLPDILKGVLEP